MGRGTSRYQRDFFVSRSWKTDSHNRLGPCVRAYVPCMCNGSRKRLDESLKFQRISSDLVYCGNPSAKTKKSLLVPGRAPPQYLKFGLRRGFFAPNQKVQKRKYVFISPINTTRLVHSPNFDFGTLSPRLPVPRKPKLKRSM